MRAERLLGVQGNLRKPIIGVRDLSGARDYCSNWTALNSKWSGGPVAWNADLFVRAKTHLTMLVSCCSPWQRVSAQGMWTLCWYRWFWIYAWCHSKKRPTYTVLTPALREAWHIETILTYFQRQRKWLQAFAVTRLLENQELKEIQIRRPFEKWKTRSSSTLLIGHFTNKIDDFMSSYQFSMHYV